MSALRIGGNVAAMALPKGTTTRDARKALETAIRALYPDAQLQGRCTNDGPARNDKAMDRYSVCIDPATSKLAREARVAEHKAANQ